MKKLFSYLMVAAVALMAACGPVEEPDDKKPAEKNFYGFEMENADIAALGNDQYLLQMYNNDEEGYTVRLVSALVTVPGVTDEILPEGTYELAAGEIGDNGNYFKGSYYQNDIAEVPYVILFNEGELEVKHTADGYRLTIWNANGFNAETGAAANGTECRYEGNAEMYGTHYPTMEDSADAIYLGPFSETANCWVFEVSVTEDIYYDIYILTESDYEAGIPSGKYPMLLTGAPDTALPTYVANNQYNGSMMLEDYEGDSYIYDMLRGGEVNVVNNGDGTYEVSVDYYNYFNIPYSVSYSGTVTHADYSSTEAEEYTVNPKGAYLVYGGQGMWLLGVEDTAFTYQETNYGFAMELYLFNDASASFDAGLASGQYTIATTGAPMTFLPTLQDEEGYPSYSMVYMTNANYLWDYISTGELTITNNGNNNYKFEFVKVGGEDLVFSGTYEGAVEVVDATAAATAVSAKAPLKANIKQMGEKKHLVQNVPARGFRK